MVVPSGATAFITNRPKPKGGEIAAISMFNSMIAPNQIGERCSASMMGKYMGTVSRIIASDSMKVPSSSNTSCMETTTQVGLKSVDVASSTMPCDAPDIGHQLGKAAGAGKDHQD